MSAVLKSNPTVPARSLEAKIFQRKWTAAVTPASPPPYEDIVIGGLGRLAENLIVVERQAPGKYKVLRCGRGLWDWTGSERLTI